jgi:hypothetical protein
MLADSELLAASEQATHHTTSTPSQKPAALKIIIHDEG